MSIDYRTVCRELLEIPEIDIKFEELALLFVGTPPIPVTDTFTCEISMGNDDSESVNSLLLKKIDGGTWLDYQQKYSEKVDNWLKFVGFNYSKYKILIVNTLSPLSIQVLKSPMIDKSVIVIAITADNSSNPLNKNTSYVALKTAYKKELPIILAEDKYVENLTVFQEEAGLMVGQSAFQYIISNYIKQVQILFNFIERDKRLGINIHSFSIVVAASNQVYKDVDTVFKVQDYLKSVNNIKGYILSINLLGLSPKEIFDNIESAFKDFYKKFDTLLNSEIILIEKKSKYNFFDIYLIYGLKEDPVLSNIEDGYKAIVSKMPMLNLV